VETDPFRIRGHVANFDEIVSDIVARSKSTRNTLPMAEDIAYGSGAGEKLDLFFPDGPRNNLPVHIFIHGGYWRMFSKQDYSYIADTVTNAGAIAVIVDYALMPAQRMAVLVDQVQRAKLWVIEHIAEHGGDPTRLTVSGHSAGAHLATFLLQEGSNGSQISAALLLGGLFDLLPLQSSFLQKEIAITDDEVRLFTPMNHRFDPGCRVTIAVGELETPPFHEQAAAFTSALRRQGVRADQQSQASRDHMSSVRDLGVPGTGAADLLRSVIQASRD